MQFLCLRTSTRNTGFESGVDSAGRCLLWPFWNVADDWPVVTQLQQETTTLKAQDADQTGLADAVRAINNLATAQDQKKHSESH